MLEAAPTSRSRDSEVLALVYNLWLGSWEVALSALATATRSRTLSESEVAAHKAVIAAEREFVTKQFTLLLGRRQLTTTEVRKR